MCGKLHLIFKKDSGIVGLQFKTNLPVLLTLLLSCQFAIARISPKHLATINYTQVLFEFDAVPNASFYIFELKKLNSNTIIANDTCLHPFHLQQKLLSYNQTYVWRVIAYSSSKKKLLSSPLYQFHIKGALRTDTSYSKIEVVKNNTNKTLNGLIMMDNNLIIDRAGNIAMTVENTLTSVRDFTLNDDGNYTFLDSTVFVEIDNTGKILWKSAFLDNDSMTITMYHHDMQKTRKGNYLCLAFVKYKKITQQVKYCCLIELNKKNEIVWFWSESGLYPNDSTVFKASHMNSLFFDEDENKVYCSNRDLSSMIKIDRATKDVEYSYGYNANDSVIFFDHRLFKMQHRIIKLDNGNFLIFNNDSGEVQETTTSILEITNPEENGGEATVVWKYLFNFQERIENYIPKMGGATILPNDNVLIATGVFDRSFEINREGEIVWEVRVSRLDVKSKKWTAVPCYRNNYISSLYPVYDVLYSKTGDGNTRQILVNAGTEAGMFTVRIGKKTQTFNLKPSESAILSENKLLSEISVLSKKKLK